eukprot:2537833-Prymnesium_polylepis.1
MLHVFQRNRVNRAVPMHLSPDFLRALGVPKESALNLNYRHVRKHCHKDIHWCASHGAVFRSLRGKWSEEVLRRLNNGSATAVDGGKLVTPDSETNVWRISRCILERGLNKSLTRNCTDATNMRLAESVRRVDCIDASHSELGRAGDCNVQPLFDARHDRQLVWYRQDFGTPGGWREIRGTQVVSLSRRLRGPGGGTGRENVLPPTFKKESSYYFDRLGKLEKYRRQIYSVTFTRHSDNLWLGLMTVIEWAKDDSERVGTQQPAFERDTTSIYLVTSRDGVHI